MARAKRLSPRSGKSTAFLASSTAASGRARKQGRDRGELSLAGAHNGTHSRPRKLNLRLPPCRVNGRTTSTSGRSWPARTSIPPALGNPAPESLAPGAEQCALGGPWHRPAGRESRGRRREARRRASAASRPTGKRRRPRDAAPPGPLMAYGYRLSACAEAPVPRRQPGRLQVGLAPLALHAGGAGVRSAALQFPSDG